MSPLMALVVVLGLPAAAVLLVFKIVDVLQRRRDDVIERQIAVTDAIHREFGAVVAPTVRRTRGGWRVTLPMDPRHPGAPRIMELAASTLGPTASVGVRSRRPFDGRGEPVLEVALVGPWRPVPRRPAPQNRERIASAMSA